MSFSKTSCFVTFFAFVCISLHNAGSEATAIASESNELDLSPLQQLAMNSSLVEELKEKLKSLVGIDMSTVNLTDVLLDLHQNLSKLNSTGREGKLFGSGLFGGGGGSLLPLLLSGGGGGFGGGFGGSSPFFGGGGQSGGGSNSNLLGLGLFALLGLALISRLPTQG